MELERITRAKDRIASCESWLHLAGEAAAGGRKRIFLGLLSASCIVVCLLFLILLILPWLGSGVYWLRHVSIFVGIAGIFALSGICLVLVFHIYTGRPLPGISGVRHLCIRLFLPLMEIVGKAAGLDKALVRRSFIKVNNELVCASAGPVQPEKLLILIPHCMQATSCKIRLGSDLANCVNCGNCQIGAIRKLAQESGCKAAIATGGTIARRIVAELRPACIIAVACERDLTSGIQDSYPIPVFGALNERPFGPCHDTRASLSGLTAAIAYFLDQKNIS